MLMSYEHFFCFDKMVVAVIDPEQVNAIGAIAYIHRDCPGDVQQSLAGYVQQGNIYRYRRFYVYLFCRGVGIDPDLPGPARSLMDTDLCQLISSRVATARSIGYFYRIPAVAGGRTELSRSPRDDRTCFIPLVSSEGLGRAELVVVV